MSYSSAPIQIPDFFKNTQVKIGDGCKGPVPFKKDCKPLVIDGYHKPLNESCTAITGHLEGGPEDSCTGVWNNLTKRKSIVKDY